MTTPRVDRAKALADLLSAAGCPATADPSRLGGRAPAVLVPPPALRFDLPVGATATWTLVAVTDSTLAGLDTWAVLDDLVDQVAALLPLERAEPASYVTTPGADPVPAYLLTYTEGVD